MILNLPPNVIRTPFMATTITMGYLVFEKSDCYFDDGTEAVKMNMDASRMNVVHKHTDSSGDYNAFYGILR